MAVFAQNVVQHAAIIILLAASQTVSANEII